MPFSVTVSPSGHRFDVEQGETVLLAALRQGIGLPYGCKNGACGSCKGRVVEGRVVHRVHQASALPVEEAAHGMALFCSAEPQSDLVIEVREVIGVGDVPIRKLPCRVTSLEPLAPDVVELTLQLPGHERFQYLAGQYIEFLLKDGKRRSYSMASAAHVSEHLHLHLRHTPGGAFTDHVFGTGSTHMKARDILRFEGPFGTFTLREDSDKPIIFVASGTGFAPIKAMIEHAEARKLGRPMQLYWGGRRPHDLYRHQLMLETAARLVDFSYVPVVSDGLPEDDWRGRAGFVHRAVMEDHPDLSRFQVYACGAPVMVDAARHDFVEHCRLPGDEFFADAFTTEADLAGQPTLAG